jgi:hypothetical protein
MVVGYKVIMPFKFYKQLQWIKCKNVDKQMQNAIALGPLKSFITQIIASHVKLNQLQVTYLRGVKPRSKWIVPIVTKDCLQYIYR